MPSAATCGPSFCGGRLELAARLLVAELGIGIVAGVAVREAEVQPGLRRVVQLVGRHVVAEHVAAVVGEPELLRRRMPVEADACCARRARISRVPVPSGFIRGMIDA